MMRRIYPSLTTRLFPLCLLFAVSLHAGPGDDAYARAEKALAAKQYDAAISAFEEALTADPDSIRDASEYRMATMQRALSLQPVVKGQPHEGKPTDYDREIAFFDKLTKDHPNSPNAFLNYGRRATPVSSRGPTMYSMRYGGGMTWNSCHLRSGPPLYFVPTGNPNPVQIGDTRKGDNL